MRIDPAYEPAALVTADGALCVAWCSERGQEHFVEFARVPFPGSEPETSQVVASDVLGRPFLIEASGVLQLFVASRLGVVHLTRDAASNAWTAGRTIEPGPHQGFVETDVCRDAQGIWLAAVVHTGDWTVPDLKESLALRVVGFGPDGAVLDSFSLATRPGGDGYDVPPRFHVGAQRTLLAWSREIPLRIAPNTIQHGHGFILFERRDQSRTWAMLHESKPDSGIGQGRLELLDHVTEVAVIEGGGGGILVRTFGKDGESPLRRLAEPRDSESAFALSASDLSAGRDSTLFWLDTRVRRPRSFFDELLGTEFASSPLERDVQSITITSDLRKAKPVPQTYRFPGEGAYRMAVADDAPRTWIVCAKSGDLPWTHKDNAPPASSSPLQYAVIEHEEWVRQNR